MRQVEIDFFSLFLLVVHFEWQELDKDFSTAACFCLANSLVLDINSSGLCTISTPSTRFHHKNVLKLICYEFTLNPPLYTVSTRCLYWIYCYNLKNRGVINVLISTEKVLDKFGPFGWT